MQILTMQAIADKLCAVVVKESTVQGMRVYAYPIAAFVPHSVGTQHEVCWQSVPFRVDITMLLDITELTYHNPKSPVYPHEFGAFLARSSFENTLNRMESEMAQAYAVAGGSL